MTNVMQDKLASLSHQLLAFGFDIFIVFETAVIMLVDFEEADFSLLILHTIAGI